MIALALSVSAAAAETAIAVFDLELIDTSLEGELLGPREDEAQRLALISDQLRAMLDEAERYRVVDLAPARAAIADVGRFSGCARCVAPIAGDLGAELAFTGTVQKVSNLILNLTVYVTDVARPQDVRAVSVDMRSNSDESWSRAVSYLVENRILAE